MIIKTCPKKDCSAHGLQYKEDTYCFLCGFFLTPHVTSCECPIDQYKVNYCTHCGVKKEFKEVIDEGKKG